MKTDLDYGTRRNRVDLTAMGEKIRQMPAETVSQAEKTYHAAVDEVCAVCRQRQTDVILLCGPSASGKTTSAKRIQAQLHKMGQTATRISLDDFYRPHSEMPFWPDGTRNFESPECLDLTRFAVCTQTLLQTGEANCPIYDFKAVRGDQTVRLTYRAGDVLIVEGLHALNPAVAAVFSGRNMLRVYVSTHTDFCMNGEIRLPAKDLRLCRRMLRDVRHRNAGVCETLTLWHYVRMGEEAYIHPFRNDADLKIDTAHAYEPFLYAHEVLQSLRRVQLDGENRRLAKTLIQACEGLSALSNAQIPENSLIQEFIGV